MSNNRKLDPGVSVNGLSPVEARAILESEAQARVTECQAEIQKVLDKYQCTLDLMVILKAGQVIPQVQIVSR